ncbi:2803_t:CDS:2 [Entrophospora sp. SA101]|nr:13777_t:CDS:2 [Entrophospora sp. SA101]CAJ0883050.1 2803_t:CDS:2 [Entrophospora sp. SA101]
MGLTSNHVQKYDDAPLFCGCHWICSQRRTKLTTKALGNISKLHMYYFSNIKRVNYGQNLSVDEMNSDCLTATTDMLESDTDCL